METTSTQMKESNLRTLLRKRWKAQHFDRPPSAASRPGPGPHRVLLRRLHQRVLQEMDEGLLTAFSDSSETRSLLRALVDRELHASGWSSFDETARKSLEDHLVAELTGLGPIQLLFDDPSVSDILVNGPHEVWVDRFGRLEASSVQFDDEAHVYRILDRVTSQHGRHIEEASPHVDVRLSDGSRLHAIIPPLSPKGPVISIRKADRTPFDIEQLISLGTVSREAGEFLRAAVRAQLNILVAGGAAAGKTTLLNVLGAFIPPGERVVTIEETLELNLPHPHVVALEGRQANVEGRGEISLRVLVKNALRMRSDRIIVGEVRGEEVFDMLQAMNVGHRGSLTTVHANGAEEALQRLETLMLLGGIDLSSSMARQFVCSAFNLVVHIARLPDGRRRLMSITEPAPSGRAEEQITLFTYDSMSDTLKASGQTPRCQAELDHVQGSTRPGGEA